MAERRTAWELFSKEERVYLSMRGVISGTFRLFGGNYCARCQTDENVWIVLSKDGRVEGGSDGGGLWIGPCGHGYKNGSYRDMTAEEFKELVDAET